MINTSVNKNEHTIQSGVVDYPIGFPFYFNPDRTPQLLVKIGDEELRFNHNFELSEDKGSVVLRPTEEESWTLEGPEDFSWMTKWDGKDLLIERAVPFVQDSDYQLGRISAEQIERDFDLSVMRDQTLDDKIRGARDEFAEANKGLSDKIDETKAELQESIDDKLPLTGGTLTGPLTIRADKSAGATLTLKNESGKSYVFSVSETGIRMPFRIYSTQDIKPSGVGEFDLGDWLNKWKTVHATGLSNKVGEFIAVPEKSGTMALLEDLKDIGLDGYVKKSGDTMTGNLVIDINNDSEGVYFSDKHSGRTRAIYNMYGLMGLHFVERDSGDTPTMQFRMVNEYFDMPIGGRKLGTDLNPWSITYTQKLNNGADLIVPTEGGTLARLEDLEGLGGDYLPLSGGTMTGDLVFDVAAHGYTIAFQDSFKNVNTGNTDTVIKRISTPHQTQGLIFSEHKNGIIDMQFTMVADGFFMPRGNRLLGSVSYPWENIYAKKLNNGADIAIPSEGGTLARIEDIPETYTKEELDAKFAEIPDSADTYSKAEIDAKLSSVYKFKGSVANVEALPTGATVGDTYNVEDTGANYAWDGSKWDKLSDTIDLSDYATVDYAEELYLNLSEKLTKETATRSSEDRQLYNNLLVLRDMLNEKDENNEFIQLTTEAKTAIPAINELKARLEASVGDISTALAAILGE